MANTQRKLFIIFGVSENVDGSIYGKPKIGTIDEFCEEINKAEEYTDGTWQVVKLGEIWIETEVD